MFGSKRKQYSSEEERIKDYFGITVESGQFAEWKEGLSDAAKSNLSDHDMALLNDIFLKMQIKIARDIETTIAYRLYNEDQLRFMLHQGVTYFPWEKKCHE